MTKDEALKLALEFLEDNKHYIIENERREYLLMYEAVIDKCKEALAQPEQEPVEWPRTMERGALVQWLHFEMVQHTLDEGTIDKLIEDAQAIPATPPQRKPLTDEEIINKCLDSGFERNSLGWSFTYGKLDYHLLKLARAIEAAHGIKENT